MIDPFLNVGAPVEAPKPTVAEWKDIRRVHEFDDGWYIGWCHDPHDLAVLGRQMRHCSGTHWIWVCEEKIWYFLALCDPDNQPHGTIHAKQASWINKRHPRDDGPPMPFDPMKPVKRTMGSYPCYADILAAFKEHGLQYEPGKFRSYQFNSCTYDYGAESHSDYESFEYQYGRLLNGGNCPPNVEKEVWASYTKAHKAVADNYRKNRGSVKIQGRRFKFDGKWLIVLSATSTGQGRLDGDYRKKVAEFLAATNKKGA